MPSFLVRVEYGAKGHAVMLEIELSTSKRDVSFEDVRDALFDFAFGDAPPGWTLDVVTWRGREGDQADLGAFVGVLSAGALTIGEIDEDEDLFE